MTVNAIIRDINGFIAEVTVTEQHTDDLTITQHPVERGAAITDHAFKMPSQLTVDIGYSAAYTKLAGYDSLSSLYAQFLNMQASATLLTVQTGKRLYNNMLIKSLRVKTDQQTENVLDISLQLQEVILVDVITNQYPPTGSQSNPESTASTKNTGQKAIQQVGS